jgi:hypothetical protein
MFNLVEVVADGDEQETAPCKYGNIVVGHACYCHRDDWPEGPRKCPVWRYFGTKDLSKWHQREWELVEVPTFQGFDPQTKAPIIKNTMRPLMPDDDLGGCPKFESRP